MKDPRDVIIAPIVSEKSYALIDRNAYTFQVHRDANKIEIRQAIEAIYSVPVKSVHTLNVRGEIRRVGRGRPGRQAGWKKAIVTLQPGARIELIEGV